MSVLFWPREGNDMSDINRFEFVPEHDGSISVEAMVFQALGAASVCWEHPEAAGVFDSTRARQIGDALVDALRERSSAVSS